MIRWSSRFRRAAAVLVGLHLLQVVLLAASAVCDLSIGDAQDHTAAVAVATAAPSHHGEHGVEQHAPAGESSPDTPHHTSHTTSCPMAMACAVTAVVVPVPTLESREVRVSAARIGHDAHMLRSMHHAPEPPPPRG